MPLPAQSFWDSRLVLSLSNLTLSNGSLSSEEKLILYSRVYLASPSISYPHPYPSQSFWWFQTSGHLTPPCLCLGSTLCYKCCHDFLPYFKWLIPTFLSRLSASYISLWKISFSDTSSCCTGTDPSHGGTPVGSSESAWPSHSPWYKPFFTSGSPTRVAQCPFPAGWSWGGIYQCIAWHPEVLTKCYCNNDYISYFSTLSPQGKSISVSNQSFLF